MSYVQLVSKLSQSLFKYSCHFPFVLRDNCQDGPANAYAMTKASSRGRGAPFDKFINPVIAALGDGVDDTRDGSDGGIG